VRSSVGAYARKKERRSPSKDCKPGSKERSEKLGNATIFRAYPLGTSKKLEITMKNPVVKTKIGSEYWFLEQSKRIHGRVILKTDVQNGLF